jgi:hypothetical protein
MAISWNEIKDRSIKFAKVWKNISSEKSWSQTFWVRFMDIFGITIEEVARFEYYVEKKLSSKKGFVDLFQPGRLLVEHKSAGENLDSAFGQAIEYYEGLEPEEMPRHIIVSDFQRIRLYNLENWKDYFEFNLEDLPSNLERFDFLTPYEQREILPQDPINIKAAHKMVELYKELEFSGYKSEDLGLFLVRLVFCMFAEDADIFERSSFRSALEIKTNYDGSNTGDFLIKLFQVLNTPIEERQTLLDDSLKPFPFVGGKLFQQNINIPAFGSKLRNLLIDCTKLDWSKLTPAIFGSMFQHVMDKKKRETLGAHYTSQENIIKLIEPLFLNDLREELKRAGTNKIALEKLQNKISKMRFFDPACGCGNFLIVTLSELRKLELMIIRILQDGQKVLDINTLSKIRMDQFVGIEIDEFAALIAEVAIWLTDHQENMRLRAEYGEYIAKLPIDDYGTIHSGNSLMLDWSDLVGYNEYTFTIGNPPFKGSNNQNSQQKQDMKTVFEGYKTIACLDYVSAWFMKVARHIQGTKSRVGFVATNSICQGEQVSVLWNLLIKEFGINIQFAYRPFKWNNLAKGKAQVDVVILGIGTEDLGNKTIFTSPDDKGKYITKVAKNISPYLIDHPNTLVTRKKRPPVGILPMVYGNKPTDGGNLIFKNKEEKDNFLKDEPGSKKYIFEYMGANELLYNRKRWCLWLKGAKTEDLSKLPKVLERVALVKQHREKSTKNATKKKAETPRVFDEIRHTGKPYLAIPEVSSENRSYLPIQSLGSKSIASNKLYMIPDAGFEYFAIISSNMHMQWTKLVSGRLQSRIQYSNGFVYNNFPWPNFNDVQRAKLRELANDVLTKRSKSTTLAKMYDELLMDDELKKAHKKLDKFVEKLYRNQSFLSNEDRQIFLLNLYKSKLDDEAKKQK